MKYFYFIFILAILLILVHSFYSWDQNQKGDHLAASFQQFIKSTHPQVIASAVEQAIKSYGQNHALVCEEIIRIVLKHSLGKLSFKIPFSVYSYIPEHPTLTKAQSVVKRTIPQRFRGWFKH